jgi:hypothetical protein
VIALATLDPQPSFSLERLQRLRRSFGTLAGGRPATARDERAIRQLVLDLGTTALPLLVRELADADDGRRRWAQALLGDLAAAHHDRTIAALRATVTDPGAPDRAKLGAVALLGELGERPPASAPLQDGDSMRQRSLGELAGYLRTPADVARAADHLVAQLGEESIEGFIGDLARAATGPAALLLDELLGRHDLGAGIRRDLRDLRAAIPEPRRRPPPPRRRPSTTLGRNPDGRRILVVAARDGRPARLRTLCALIGGDGRLADVHLVEDLALGSLAAAILDPLVAQGFAFDELGLDAARGWLIQAARTALLAGAPLPRDFYLGRDLLGLGDEHLDGTSLRDVDAELAALSEHAAALLRDGESAAARPLLERYVAERPDDPDGHAHLGLCALGLGDPETARRELARAAYLGPEEPLHQWNLCAVAWRTGDREACHDALTRYLALRDLAPEAAARRVRAERYLAELETIHGVARPAAAPVRGRARRITRRRRRR